MSDLVDPNEIEKLVGTYRRDLTHTGRYDPKSCIFYIQHSFNCLNSNEDLRDCPFSLALDDMLGCINHLPTVPSYLEIRNNRLTGIPIPPDWT